VGEPKISAPSHARQVRHCRSPKPGATGRQGRSRRSARDWCVIQVRSPSPKSQWIRLLKKRGHQHPTEIG
jgi:hypothetical protein